MSDFDDAAISPAPRVGPPARIVVGSERMGSKVLWAVDADGRQAHTEPVCTVHVCAPAVFTPEQVADALNRYMAGGAPTPAMIAAVQRLHEMGAAFGDLLQGRDCGCGVLAQDGRLCRFHTASRIVRSALTAPEGPSA